MTDELGVGDAEDFGGSTVYGSQRSIERDCQCHVIQGIDQFFEIALRAHDQLAELIELLFRGVRSDAILEAFQNVLEVGNFALAAEGVGGK